MSKEGEASSTLNSRRAEIEKKMRDMASAVLTELRLEGTLCDVVIRVGDVEFEAHKVILCTCSPYFRTLFTGAWATSKKQMHTIPGVSPEMMHLIINYAYSHSVPVTEDNVVEVLAAADQFMVTGIVQTCCLFLENQLCPRNCIGIWRLVDFYHCPEMRQKVFLYILRHFEEIVRVSEELVELSVEQLAAVIEDDHLNVKRENTVFEAVVCWINYLPDQRRGHISALLHKVRFGLMTIDYIQNTVLENDVIKDNIEYVSIINDAVGPLLGFRANKRSKLTYSNPLTRPRLPPAILLATGGKNGNIAATSLEAYDVRADCWVTVGTAEIWRSHHGAAVLNNFVYLVGGCNGDIYLNSVQKFDLVTCTWHQVAPMNLRRCYVSVAVQNGCIYAMGGYNGSVYYNTVECYKPETDQWSIITPMHVKRGGASSATLNGKVYICGGYNGHRSLSSAEYYNPSTRQWTMIPAMRYCRSGLGVAAYRNCIYAVGGTIEGNCCLRSVEAYNPQTNRWNQVPCTRIPRSYFGIEVINDQLYVVGGYNGVITVQTVERYDEDDGMWYRGACIDASRSGLSCCVLNGLDGVAETLFPRGPLKLSTVEEEEEETAAGSS